MASITVYYHPLFGRAGALVRMLEHAKVPYTFKSNFPELASVASSFGGLGDTFAPPVVVDGDNVISQSTATAFYIGQKTGLDAGIPSAPKALQHLADIVDVFENGIASAKAKGGKELKVFLEGGRFEKLVSNLERGIKGPFYYGDQPTFVDFFLVQHVDFQAAVFLNRLKAEKGVDAFGAYPKIQGIVDGIRELPSYSGYAGPLQTIRPDMEAKDELFADYN